MALDHTEAIAQASAEWGVTGKPEWQKQENQGGRIWNFRQKLGKQSC